MINKTDADAGDELYETYRKSGIEVLRVSARTGDGIDALRERICGKVSASQATRASASRAYSTASTARSGAEVGAISDRIGRGRHTTRHVELHPIEGGGYIADTPGFSSFETEQMDLVLARDLEYAFPEFAPYLGRCRFTGCAHVKEKAAPSLRRSKTARSQKRATKAMSNSMKA